MEGDELSCPDRRLVSARFHGDLSSMGSVRSTKNPQKVQPSRRAGA